MNNPTDFDIFEFLGIPVTDNLEVIQKALDALPASKMAELKKNPAFSKMRSLIFTKTATAEFREYVNLIRQGRNNAQNQQNPKPDISNDEPLEPVPDYYSEMDYDQEKNNLQHIADVLNQTPKRKMSLVFLYSWFLGNKDVLIGMLNFVFFAIPAIFLLLGRMLGISSIELSEIWWVLLCLFMGVLGLVLFYPFCKAVCYLKSGYFTVAYLTQHGLKYKDRTGAEHFWTLPKRHFHQPLMTCLHNPDEPYLIAVGSNPKKIMVFDAQCLPETNDRIDFSIFMGGYSIIVSYDKRNKAFFTELPKMWRVIIPIGMILWTTLWFFVSFFPAT